MLTQLPSSTIRDKLRLKYLDLIDVLASVTCICVADVGVLTENK
jgi:hypothetical protein